MRAEDEARLPDSEPCLAPASIQARWVREGALSASELLEAHLRTIARLNPGLNALVTVDEEAAREQARAADRALQSRHRPGPLHGVPVSFKDAFETRGLRTTASHLPLALHVPREDATVVARLRAAGAVVLAKSNLPELAGDVECDSRVFGATRNPWNPALTPGGSSGGGAVAVACGMSALDIGSDLAGSLRIPAHFCGVYSLKPTDGRVPGSGHIPPLPGRRPGLRHLWTFGPLARAVEDLALALELLAGPDAREPALAPVDLAAPRRGRRRLRIAWCAEFDDVPVCPATRATIEAAAAGLADAGALVAEVAPAGFDFEGAWQTYGEIIGVENVFSMPIPWRQRLATHLLPAWAWKNNAMSRAVARARRLGLGRYMRAHARRLDLICELERFLQHWDAWLVPVSATPAFAPTAAGIDKGRLQAEVGAQRVPYWVARISHTTVFSVTGSPVVTIPAGQRRGLPVGLQLVGHRWRDAHLLDTARRVASHLPGYQPPPVTRP